MNDQVDLVCRTITEGGFTCVSLEPDRPIWVYPVVIAVFLMALLILVLVARMTLRAPGGSSDRNRRIDDDKPVRLEANVQHRKVE